MQCPALASPCLARQLRAGSMQPSPRKAAASAALGTPRFRGRDASPTLSSPPTPRQGQFAQRRLSASVPPSRRSVSRTSPPRAAAGAPPPPASGNGPSASSGGWSSVLTLPTILTLLRVAAVPALLAAHFLRTPAAATATFLIFVIASLTDWLDGYLARKMNITSEFGAFLDPVADKLMVATALILLCAQPPEALVSAPLWWVAAPSCAIIGREITMSALREWAASAGGEAHRAVAVNSLGKWKTAAQMVGISALLASDPASAWAAAQSAGGWLAAFAGGETLALTGVALVWISAGLSLVSLAVYSQALAPYLLR